MARLAMFDIDGTLVDSSKVDTICFVRSVKEEFGIKNIDDRWEVYRHATDSGVFEEIFEHAFSRKPTGVEIKRHVARLADLLEEYYEKDNLLFREIAGAGEVLRRLKQHPDWRIGIATGSWRESALFKLRSAGLDVEGIPLATGSDSISREEILLRCIEDSKRHYSIESFEKIVSVGDAVWDLKTAAKMNIGFIGINKPEKFGDIGSCRVLADYANREIFMEYIETAAVPIVHGL